MIVLIRSRKSSLYSLIFLDLSINTTIDESISKGHYFRNHDIVRGY